MLELWSSIEGKKYMSMMRLIFKSKLGKLLQSLERVSINLRMTASFRSLAPGHEIVGIDQTEVHVIPNRWHYCAI